MDLQQSDPGCAENKRGPKGPRKRWLDTAVNSKRQPPPTSPYHGQKYGRLHAYGTDFVVVPVEVVGFGAVVDPVAAGGAAAAGAAAGGAASTAERASTGLCAT